MQIKEERGGRNVSALKLCCTKEQKEASFTIRGNVQTNRKQMHTLCVSADVMGRMHLLLLKIQASTGPEPAPSTTSLKSTFVFLITCTYFRDHAANYKVNISTQP